MGSKTYQVVTTKDVVAWLGDEIELVDECAARVTPMLGTDLFEVQSVHWPSRQGEIPERRTWTGVTLARAAEILTELGVVK